MTKTGPCYTIAVLSIIMTAAMLSVEEEEEDDDDYIDPVIWMLFVNLLEEV